MSTWLIVLIVIVCLIILLTIVSEGFREILFDIIGVIIEAIVDIFD